MPPPRHHPLGHPLCRRSTPLGKRTRPFGSGWSAPLDERPRPFEWVGIPLDEAHKSRPIMLDRHTAPGHEIRRDRGAEEVETSFHGDLLAIPAVTPP
jgi:hypothetical protein